MPRKCKVCESNLRPDIEKLINLGAPYQEIALFCQKNGLEITATSIQRHVDNGHFDGFNRQDYRKEGLNMNDLDDNEEDFQAIECPNIQDSSELRAYAKDTLTEIVANQLAILKTKQIRYMKGQGRYPQNEITGLKTILSCLSDLTDNSGQALDTDRISK
jgi:hypothetical protein